MPDRIRLMNSEQAKAFMDSRKPSDFTLLDVRQAWEYETFHLPGAQLVPLTELPDRLEEINSSKPVIVYCHSGGRSSAAASLLQGQGYGEVVNLVGGASAWKGEVAYGPIELGMIAFTGRETPVEVVMKAYVMERNLQSYYSLRADMAETLDRIELFIELAGYEDRHMDTLYELYTRLEPAPLDRDAFENRALENAGELAEGGVRLEEFLSEYAGAFDEDLGFLEVAAMIEAQALDFYLRCKQKAELPETVETLELLAREEKAHLRILGRHMVRPEA